MFSITTDCQLPHSVVVVVSQLGFLSATSAETATGSTGSYKILNYFMIIECIDVLKSLTVRFVGFVSGSRSLAQQLEHRYEVR